MSPSRPVIRFPIIALAVMLVAAPVAAQEQKPAAVATQEQKPAAAATKEKKSPYVAIVNGKGIPKNRADAMVAAQAAQGQPDSEQMRTAVREELIRRELLVQAAQKKKIDKKPEIQGQMELARQSVLITAYMQDWIKNHPIAENSFKKEYDKIKQQLGDKEYKVRHILVEKEGQAKDIIARLDKGEKFEELAKQSKDPGSKDHGGELGWATPASYVRPFSEAVVKLEKGKYTTVPVKSDFGYHVIMLEDTRPLQLPSLEEAKPQLTQRLQQEMVEKYLLDLRAKAKVE